MATDTNRGDTSRRDNSRFKTGVGGVSMPGDLPVGDPNMSIEEMTRRWPSGEGHWAGDDYNFHKELGSFDGEPTFPPDAEATDMDAHNAEVEEFYGELKQAAASFPPAEKAWVLGLDKLKDVFRMSLVQQVMFTQKGVNMGKGVKRKPIPLLEAVKQTMAHPDDDDNYDESGEGDEENH